MRWKLRGCIWGWVTGWALADGGAGGKWCVAVCAPTWGRTHGKDALPLKLFSKIASFRSALSAIAMAFALPACAQVAQTPAQAANDADPALWVVKDKDTTIYLFGTIHVLKPGMTWFDEAVK